MLKKEIFFAALLVLTLAIGVSPRYAVATPDQFVGDSAIYGGQPTVLQPNVLIIIDTTGSMADPPTSSGTTTTVNYSSSTTFDKTPNCYDSSGLIGYCDPTVVYDASYNYFNSSVSNITTSCFGSNPQSSLSTYGYYNGYKLNSDGSCCTKTTGSGSSKKTTNCGSAQYQIGNYINWVYDYNQSNALSKLEIAQSVIGTLIMSTSSVKFGLMGFRYLSGANKGATLVSATVSSGTYISEVKDMDTIFTGTVTNREALVQTLNTLTAQGGTPLGTSLFEALRYFQGGASLSGSSIGITSGVYTTPIEYGCQKNYVIFITDGMSNSDSSSVLTSTIYNTYSSYDGTAGSAYKSNINHSLAGVAKYMYEHDLLSGVTGTQNVTTYTIGFGLSSTSSDEAEGIALLQLAADSSHGRGAYYAATSAQTLSKALTSVISQIFTVNTSFVAPVVPVNPQNNVYSGERVYMGFFKPESGADWAGNLKKYALASYTTSTTTYYSQVVDVNGSLATYVDENGDGYDDRDGLALPSGTSNGGFRATVPNVAKSFWSATADGSDVMSGGVGALLYSRSNAISCSTCSITGTPRKIYTYLGSSTDLTNSTNLFNVSNSNITATILGLPGSIISTSTTTDVKQLINYVHGFDVYDDNSNGSSTDKRSWSLGDILHSKPQVISYASYSFDAANEANCTKNKTIIYVGSNDGMLHAFNDCDGSEAWAFIPPDLLSTLQYLRDTTHTYFVDNSVQSYVYDANKNGTIDSGDKVILIVGLRRGGGVMNSTPTAGFYYALDVTDPSAPKYMWKISNAATGFTDMGEAWSDAKLSKILVGSSVKEAMFIGGGYDNCNEDSRFGSTQMFTGTCVTVTATTDGGVDSSGNPITSSGSALVSSLTSTNYKGRSVYLVELATLNSGVPDFSNSGSKIWGYTMTGSPALEFSMVSDMALIDSNYDGYVDRAYMGDSGGNMWRFDLTDTSTANWKVTKIFSANPGYTNYASDGSNGRKIFYRPSVVIAGTTVTMNGKTQAMARLYFGTGDREHPLNRAVVDRFYEVLDKGQLSAVTEAKLVDVTDDLLQTGTDTQVSAEYARLSEKEDSTNTNYYGWYIRLNSGDRTTQVLCNGVACPGEKVLAQPTVYNGVVYFTTYAPTTDTSSSDPCSTGNLGTGYTYAVKYWSGASVYNYDTSNDSLYSSYKSNSYATSSGSSNVLLRTDRHVALSSGIPSSVVVVPGQSPLIGCGGGLCTTNLSTGSRVLNIYWRAN